MRMMPTRYTNPLPAQVKKAVSQIKHLQPPLKGLQMASKLTTGDPLTATILKNFNVEDDRILSRAGYVLQATCAGNAPIEHLVPYYGDVAAMLAATNNTLCNATTGTVVKGGFQSDDWMWTSFANLGEAKFTVMVNGRDGVWSWDGGFAQDQAASAATSLSNANPAVVTVALADIGRFVAGNYVFIAGADAAHAKANGYHRIGTVTPASGTFQLLGVDLTAAPGAQTSGVTAAPAGSLVKEIVTAPGTASYIVPDQLQLVLSHMNRLWFADGTNLAVYYLPLQQKSGELKVLPLNALFKRGGFIKAMYTWTLEGGTGLNDQLVIFSSNGECVIYSGTDAETDFQLNGIFRFDTPMTKHSCINYGGDLYVLIPTGVVPLSTMLRAESEQLGQSDKAVISLFLEESTKSATRPGWQLFLNPSSGRLITNMPTGSIGDYRQMIRHMPRPVWSEWCHVPARCWGWINPFLYFGDDKGRVYRMHPSILNDDGQPIIVDVQQAWNLFGTPAIKHFKMLQPYLSTDGDPKPALDIKVDYDFSEPINVPDITFARPGAMWDVAEWDVDYWAGDEQQAVKLWQGTAVIGRVGAPRFRAQLLNCRLAINGWDVVYETGAVVG